MSRRLIIEEMEGVRYAALFEGTRLRDLYAERVGAPSQVGAIFIGRITRRLSDGSSAFVDLGDGLSGFLSARKPLKKDDRVLVQVTGDGAAGKAPELSFSIHLPGRFLVHLPFGSGFSYSQKMPEAARAGLATVLAGMAQNLAARGLAGGFVVRSAAAEATATQLQEEAGRLAQEGQRILTAYKNKEGGQRLHPPPTVLGQMVLDAGDQAFAEVIFSTPALKAHWREVISPIAPEWREAGVVAKDDAFAALDVPTMIENLKRPTVMVDSDIRLRIDETATLAAVDVDLGARRDFLAANRLAATAIARQIRLRNLAGIIVIDFPRLTRRQDRDALLAVFAEAVADDPAGVTVYGFTKLGLLEVTRRRRGESLSQLLRPERERDSHGRTQGTIPAKNTEGGPHG